MPELSDLTGEISVTDTAEDRAERSLAALNAWAVVTGVLHAQDAVSEGESPCEE